MQDRQGVDLWPLVAAAAAREGLSARLVLALLQAESGLNPWAERWGMETAPAKTALAAGDWATLARILAQWSHDTSFGLSQITVPTARGLGVGDGSASVENALAVRQALFNRRNAVDLGARHLASCWRRAGTYDLSHWGISRELAALVIYNAGMLWPPSDPWWQRWDENVQAYESALAWAAQTLGEEES